jgi:hypothetical protein
MKLCSEWDLFHRVSCDLPTEHEGEHQATVFWGFDGDEETERPR